MYWMIRVSGVVIAVLVLLAVIGPSHQVRGLAITLAAILFSLSVAGIAVAYASKRLKAGQSSGLVTAQHAVITGIGVAVCSYIIAIITGIADGVLLRSLGTGGYLLTSLLLYAGLYFGLVVALVGLTWYFVVRLARSKYQQRN